MAIKKKNDSKRRFYLSIVMTMTLFIVLTIIMLSSVLYVNFEKAASDQIYLANMESLKKVDNEVSIMSKTALTISNQIFRDLSVSKLMYYSVPDIFDMSLAVDQLTNYRLSIPFIDSIYVYNRYINRIYTEPGNSNTIQTSEQDFSDKQITDIISHYRSYKPYEPIPRIYKNPDGITKYLYTFIMYDYVAGGSILYNSIFVNISEDWINNVTSDSTESKGSNTFIINNKGMSVSHNNVYKMMENYSDRSYIKRILADKDSSGYFLNNVDGINSLIVYTGTDVYGWRFVRIIPYTTVFEKIEAIRTVTIFVSFGILLLGIILSFIISKRLYNPIRALIANLEDSLEADNRDITRLMKQEFLRNLAEGRTISSRVELEKKYEKLNIKLDFDNKIIVLLFKVDDYSTFMQNNNIEDRNLLKFAIINISCEVLSDTFKTEAADMGGDKVLVILETDGSSNDTDEDVISNKLQFIKSSLKEYLDLSVSVCVSLPGNSIMDIQQLYNSVLETSLYRLFYGHGCTIFSSRINDSKTKEYNYPVQKEKLLIEALMAGKIQETRNIYDDIMGETVKYPIVVFNLTISHLIFTLNNAIKIIRNNNSIPDLGFITPLMYTNNIETNDEINRQFYELFEKIAQSLDERKSLKYEELIIKIENMIQNEYTSQDISIDSMARALKMSVPHLCRIYKQHTLCTIQQKITEARMNKARELLAETEVSIVDIAERTGFSNSNYFFKAFKASNGVTPKEYRKNNKK